jgi:two-component system CheB/CheR fusion protein
VDLFFRSLADTHGPHALAIILSGADGDGAIGIKRIKERGGLTIAQDPDEAEHAGMPRTAIDTGMVDWVLQVAEMPRRLLAYRDSEETLQLPPEEGPQPAQAPRPSSDEGEAALREALVFLRMRTGRDFSYYKRATILRRVARRMQVNAVDDLPSYLSFLRAHAGETGALLQDLLISVTNFFRDRDAFTALELHIPHLFKNKNQGDAVRVWVPACATGEEAYSIAMLLLEHARKLESPPSLQVFACDLNEDAIAEARAGLYPEAITADVNEDRLRKFFVKDGDGYRVRRELREMVLFAAHDLLKDAPFSRMDLISCRNLLIYLNRDAQKRVFETFHFALRPDGRLFLGSSEAVDDGNPLFRVVDKKHRIYAPQPAARIGLPVPSGPSSLLRVIESQERASNVPVVHGRRFVHDPAVAFQGTLGPPLDRTALAELHFKLIERIAAPSLLINSEQEIVHLSESVGRFLQLVGGEPTTNLLRMVPPMLRIELRAAIFRAIETNATVEVFNVSVEMDGETRTVDIRVSPAHEVAPGFLLVIFEMRDRPEGETLTPLTTSSSSEPVVRQLERELEQVKLHLRDTVEQYEASTEEMKASNEELQAMNEELRSATEELETSREELQSINEELTTVNSEMKSRVDELAHTNSDLQNLMASTAIATVFLDRDLAITRYTPTAVELFHLIPGDLGRPLAHLKHRLDYAELLADAARVLKTLVPVEREVRDEGHWYLARLQPYRTLEDHIAGVVLTFVDVTERKAAEHDLAQDLQRTERLRQVGEQLGPEGEPQVVFNAILDTGIALMEADAGTLQLLDAETQELHLLAAKGFSPEAVEQFARIAPAISTAAGEALASGRRAFADFDTPDPTGLNQLHLDAGLLSGQSTPLMARSGRSIGVLSTHWKAPHRPAKRVLRFFDLLTRQAADAIERKLSDGAQHLQMEELTRFNSVAVGRETRMIELKKEVNELARRLGQAPRYPLDFEKEE